MKKSTKFWIIISFIVNIFYQYFWYYYETKMWPNATFADNTHYTCLIGICAFIFDLLFIGHGLLYIIPKFNDWLDK